MKKGKILYNGAALSGLIAMAIISQGAEAADSLGDALSGGKVSLDIRYRYESVTQNNALKDANASTVRSRLGYGTDAYHGVAGYLEFEDISAVGAEDYNSGSNGKTAYSVVADPVGTEVNQAYLSFANIPATTVKYGRQVIILDNQRFIGSVGWRQNEQTFDALSVVNSSLPDTVVTYAHLSNADRITGGNAAMSSNLLNVNYKGLSVGALSAYLYLLDYDQTPSASTQTYGLRFNGGSGIGDSAKLLYTVELAQQSDYGKNPASFSLNYTLVELGGMWSGVTGKLGYEVLEGDGTYSVQTPLATLHAFNGWTDQFLATPASGLEDSYLSVGGAVMGTKLLAVYHDFKANKGGGDLGSEIDALVAKKFGKMYTIMLKYGSYSAGSAAGKVDTDKLWLMGELAI